jgi:carbon monoxide dehydrogenase subunit G
VVTVTRTFTVDKPADVVVSYLADFSNAVDWDPGTQSCERQETGPVMVGSTWRNVSKFLGRETVLHYRLEALEPGHVTLIGANKTATSADDITVRDTPPNGSEVTYEADIELDGLHGVAVAYAAHRLGSASEVLVEADGGATGRGVDLHEIAELVGEPETSAMSGIRRRRKAAGQR